MKKSAEVDVNTNLATQLAEVLKYLMAKDAETKDAEDNKDIEIENDDTDDVTVTKEKVAAVMQKLKDLKMHSLTA